MTKDSDRTYWCVFDKTGTLIAFHDTAAAARRPTGDRKLTAAQVAEELARDNTRRSPR